MKDRFAVCIATILTCALPLPVDVMVVGAVGAACVTQQSVANKNTIVSIAVSQWIKIDEEAKAERDTYTYTYTERTGWQ